MNVSSYRCRPRLLKGCLWLAGALLSRAAPAFPPVPHHLVFGLVRDEQGNPLQAEGAEVFLDAPGASPIRAQIAQVVDQRTNYRLIIPLDAEIAAGLYKPTALHPAVSFRLRVKIGVATYLPIEMTGTRNLVTTPGGSSRVDLTLGVDSDGDGLPDAWERALIAARGGPGSLADIQPDDDSDGDGMSNLQEYLAGTYAFDPVDGFTLNIVGVDDHGSFLEFTAIRGRTYTVQTSADLRTWKPLPFTVPGDQGSPRLYEAYSANEIRRLRIQVAPEADELEFSESQRPPRIFRLMVR